MICTMICWVVLLVIAISAKRCLQKFMGVVR